MLLATQAVIRYNLINSAVIEAFHSMRILPAPAVSQTDNKQGKKYLGLKLMI
jgi:hypothetical protein